MLEHTRRDVVKSVSGIVAMSSITGLAAGKDDSSAPERVQIDTNGVTGIDEAIIEARGDERIAIVRGTVTPGERASSSRGATYSIEVNEKASAFSSENISARISEASSVPTSVNSTTVRGDTTTSQVSTSNSPGQGSDSGTDPTNDYEGGAFVTHHNVHGAYIIAKSEQGISWEETNGEVDWIWRGHNYHTDPEWGGQTSFNGLDWSGDTVLSRVAGEYTQSFTNDTIDHRVNLTGKPNGEMDWETIWWASKTGESWGYNTGYYNENVLR